MSPHCSCFHGPSHCGSKRGRGGGGGGGGERRGEERRGEERRGEERRGRGEERRGRGKEREGEGGRYREGGREREGEGGGGWKFKEGWWEGKLKQSLCAKLETTVMRVEDSQHSKQCRPNQTFPSHCVALKVILGLSLTAPCSLTYYNLRASPSNKLQTYLKEPLEDQQTILHFRRVGHLNLSCLWEKRSFCWLQHYCTNWTFGFTVDWNLWNAEIAPWLVPILSSLVLRLTNIWLGNGSVLSFQASLVYPCRLLPCRETMRQKSWGEDIMETRPWLIRKEGEVERRGFSAGEEPRYEASSRPVCSL